MVYQWGNRSLTEPNILEALLPSKLDGHKVVQISAGGFGFSGALTGILYLVRKVLIYY